MRIFKLFVFVLLLIELTKVSATDSETLTKSNISDSRMDAAENLKKELLKRGSTSGPPYPDDGGPLIIDIYTELRTLQQVDQERETIQLKQYRRMKWHDDRLAWNPSDFRNITTTRFFMQDMWLPDILSIDNNFDEQLIPIEFNLGYLDYNGSVSVYFAERIETQCDFDMNDFPFDIQTCLTSYTSWTHHSELVRLTATLPMSQQTCAEASSSEFNIIGCFAHIELRTYGTMEPEHNYDHYVRTIKIARKAGFYVWTQLIPTGVITCLAIVGLFCPSTHLYDRTEKVTLGLTALLAIAVMLMTVSSTIPRNFQEFPSLGYFYLIELSVCSISTVVAAGLMRAHAWCQRVGKRPFVYKKIMNNQEGFGKFAIKRVESAGKRDETLHEILRQLSEMQMQFNSFFTGKDLEDQIKKDFDMIDLCLLIVLLAANLIILMNYTVMQKGTHVHSH